ncbi:TetR family transcriptional regulator [Prauserella sp. PE36]|uniref:TetR/AcrR family transcriptional regulator n=1 Tax=Prauserella endophytica TaxID=1592324 RepID=A0ABY2RYL2_9PSEU|nr:MULTISPECIES: TetR/AcrR family transcriptional regulator [Prauserella]PXY33515.1 TetR family transcriptional regulator [Prauserella coralliicola]RBM21713.1 TetR family transcriptional regulator [Prauserella sp. PE36]TKG65771.1 TetR/AcrR family transcriptional regulator [Prauserella endophytica]
MARISNSVRQPFRVDEIVDIAVGVFLERGYDATSMGDLAKAAGITKSSFYYHVSSKEELFELGVGRALDALFLVLKEHESVAGPAVGRIRHVLRRLVEIVTRQRPEVALLVRARGNTPVEKRALARRKQFDLAMTLMVEQAIAEGGLRIRMEPALFSRLALGAAVSVVEWYRPGGSVSARDLVDAVESLVFDSPVDETAAPANP